MSGSTTSTERSPVPRPGRAAAAVLALALLALLALALTTGTAVAAEGDPPPTPTPYGGLLDRPDPGSQVDFDQVLEVGMLALGTVNGLVFAGAVIASRFRGSSHAATRRALSARTGRGRISEAPRRPRTSRGTVGAGSGARR